ncbi:hypothetical protein AbraIFM66950_009662 [Aspergillus brasiliensis]|nr:hypothetical protein AbraIFM66950_009662 [Aspergillus brasiliensis]
MASSVVDGHWIYNVPCDRDFDVWTKKTFLPLISPLESTEDVLNSLGLVELPMLLHLKDRNEFLLKPSHCHSDTQGIAMWFHDFLNELSRPNTDTVRWKLGEEVKNLPLETWDAAAVPKLTQSWVDDHRGFFPKKHPKASKTLSLANEPDPSQRQPAYRFERHRFSVKETDSVVASARRLGLTLTPFSHTAIALAAKEQGDLPDGVQHNTFLVSSLRGQCKGPPELGSHAVALRFGLWPIQIPVYGFRETSKALMNYVLADMDPDIVNDVMSSYIISNMGDCSSYIQASYGEIQLEDYWAINLPANSSIFFIIESRLGQLEMRTCYNSAFYDLSRIKSLLDLTCKVLLDASTEVHL